MAVVPSRLLLLLLVMGLFASPLALAHDQKEYTVILGSEGARPDSISEGLLVETDSIFFRNHDSREDARHRILVDADGDGAFEGVDDFDTGWMVTSCELNETGHKLDENCQTASMVLLAPENGLMPGNVSMLHQVEFEGAVTEAAFFAVFTSDDHSMPTGPSQPEVDDSVPVDFTESALRGLVISMAALAIVLFSRLIASSDDE